MTETNSRNSIKEFTDERSELRELLDAMYNLVSELRQLDLVQHSNDEIVRRVYHVGTLRALGRDVGRYTEYLMNAHKKVYTPSFAQRKYNIDRAAQLSTSTPANQVSNSSINQTSVAQYRTSSATSTTNSRLLTAIEEQNLSTEDIKQLETLSLSGQRAALCRRMMLDVLLMDDSPTARRSINQDSVDEMVRRALSRGLTRDEVIFTLQADVQASNGYLTFDNCTGIPSATLADRIDITPSSRRFMQNDDGWWERSPGPGRVRSLYRRTNPPLADVKFLDNRTADPHDSSDKSSSDSSPDSSPCNSPSRRRQTKSLPYTSGSRSDPVSVLIVDGCNGGM